jgi:hypothetical protein
LCHYRFCSWYSKFFRFVNFYWHFIAHYSMIMVLLICWIQKDQTFTRGPKAKCAFWSLKASFTTTPLLIHVDPSRPFILEMNIFRFIIGVILSQFGNDNLFHRIDFHSCKFFQLK